MIPMLRQHYPYAVFALLGVLSLLGDGALFIMGMALAIGGIPLAFACEAEEIARDMNRRADPPNAGVDPPAD